MTNEPASVPYARKWTSAFWALLTGSVAVGLLQGLLRLPLPGTIFGRELLVLCVVGSALAALLSWPPVWLLARLRRPPQPPRTASAFWIGWGVGLAPLAANILGTGFHFLALACGGVVCLAAPAIGALLAPGRPLRSALLFLGCAAWPVGAVVFGPPPLRFGPAELPAVDGEPALRVAGDAKDVILVSIDTLRADVLDGPRSRDLRTLQRLKREGRSGRARSSSNQTLPGHVGMLTGTSALQHGVRSNRGMLPARLTLVSQTFREAGWSTVGVVSNGLLRGSAGFSRGFDLYDDDTVAHAGAFRAFLGAARRGTWLGWMLPEGGIRSVVTRGLLPRAARELQAVNGAGSGGRVRDRALGYLHELTQRPQPYFLFLHFMDPHTPYGAPQGFRGRYSDALAPFPSRYDRDEERFAEATLAAVSEGLRNGEAEAALAVDHLRARYDEEVAFVDHCLGEILSAVEAAGRPTVVLVTSDHGEHFGEHELLEHANSLFEPLVQVPFLLWGAGIEAGALPALDLARVPAILTASAKALRIPELEEGDAVVWSWDEDAAAVWQQSRKWLFRWPADAPAPLHEAFFDLRRDPREEASLGETGLPPDLRRLVEEQWAKRARPEQGDATPEHEAILEALGYAGGDDE